MALTNLEKFGIKPELILNDGYKYIIGLDLGDGEVTASYWKLSDPLKEPRDLKLSKLGDGNKILSGVFVFNNGGAIIGTLDQLRQYSEDKGHLYVNFKVNPRRLDEGELFEGTTNISKKYLVSLFATECLKSIRELNSDNNYDFTGKGILAVGCPSSDNWLKDERDVKYAQLIAEAAKKSEIDVTVVIMPESRASLLKVYKENVAPEFRARMRNGVIVLDSGSSTFDVTYIDFNKNKQLDFSIPLGAAAIEKRMLRSALAKDGFNYSDVIDPLQTRLFIRALKEAYYVTCNNDASANLRPAYIELSDDNSIRLRCTEDFMNLVTQTEKVTYSTEDDSNVCGSWSSLHKSFLSLCHSEICKITGNNSFNGLVLLTGGASEMNFLQANTKEVFPDALIVKDKKASFCVSRGLSWAMFSDIMAYKLIEEAKKRINEAVISKLYDLKSLMAGNIAPIAYEYVCNCLKDWVETGEQKTLLQITKEIEEGFRNVTNKSDTARKDAINKSVQNAIQDFLNASGDGSVRKIIVSVVNELFAQTFPGNIKESNIATFKIENATWKKAVDDVADTDNTKMSSTLIDQLDLESSLTKTLKNNFFVAILVLPFYIIAAIWDEICGTDYSDKIDNAFKNDCAKVYNREDREKVYEKSLSNKEKNIAALKKELVATIFTVESERAISKQITMTLEPAIDKAVDNVSLYF